MIEKRLIIPTSEDTNITLRFTRAKETDLWVCHTTNEALTDMQEILNKERLITYHK